MIKVELVQKSINPAGGEICTLLLEYPRVIHSQLMTHRVFSRNSSSTRAVPLLKAIEQIENNPAQFIWTQNQRGMQGPIITDPSKLRTLNKYKDHLFEFTSKMVMRFQELGVHKQNAGRFLEPFQNIKVCLTSTEWDNWDWLRDDPDAQGEIAELARKMKEARDSEPGLQLTESDWHVPFVDRKIGEDGLEYWVGDTQVSLEDAIKVSMSCCAQTSYRNLDDSLDKAEDIYQKLFSGNKVHASPAEHQAKSMADDEPLAPTYWSEGITHITRDGELWSGNFRGWIQNRQLLSNHDGAKLGVSKWLK